MRTLFLASFFAFLTDQASKIYIMRVLDMQVGDRLEIFAPFLVFVFGWNPGINFGLFSNSPETSRWILTVLAIAISLGLIWWARTSLSRPITFAAAGLVIGGALGNALDRVLYGAVADFLNMSCCGIDNRFIFNIADIWIFAGAFALIIFTDEKSDKKTP